MSDIIGRDRVMKVLSCRCDHEYQDEKYGKNMRIHNKKADGKGYRCTVCADEKGK